MPQWVAAAPHCDYLCPHPNAKFRGCYSSELIQVLNNEFLRFGDLLSEFSIEEKPILLLATSLTTITNIRSAT